MAIRNFARGVGLVAILFCNVLARGQSRTIASPAQQARNSEASLVWLRAHLHVREATGRNDGPDVTAIIRAAGGTPGEEYCGDTQFNAQKAWRGPTPAGPAGSYNWFLNPTRTYFLLGVRGSVDSLKVGHCIGIYSPKRKRIAHITRVAQLGRPVRAGRPPRGYFCIGGNEGLGVNAGIHLNFYPASGIYAAANWSY